MLHNSSNRHFQQTEASQPTPTSSVDGGGDGKAGESPEDHRSAVASVASHRGSGVSSITSTLRRKPKDIPAPTIDQKAAAGRAAAGLERQERLKAARASGVSEQSGDEEEEAIRMRLEEEMDQQVMP